MVATSERSGPDRRSALDWYKDNHSGRRPRRRLPVQLAVMFSIAIVLGLVYAGGAVLGFDPTTSSRDAVANLLNDIPDLPPLDPLPGPPTEPPDPGRSPDPDPESFKDRYKRILQENPDLTEGEDFSFIDKVFGVPVHWSCERAIPVVLSGKVPDGVEPMFKEVVNNLAESSGLPLQPVRDDNHRPPKTGELVVYYAAFDAKPGSFSVGKDAVGRGGPRAYVTGPTAGLINGGEVVVRDDYERLDLLSEDGEGVLVHEIMHALGVGHSEEGLPEVMAPIVNGVWPPLGPGDSVALKVVGCDAP